MITTTVAARAASTAAATVPGNALTVRVASDTLTPVAAAMRLGDRLAFLLESVEGGARYGRYSMVGVQGRTLTVDAAGARLRGPGVDDPAVELDATDPLEALRSVLGADGVDAPGDLGFPLGAAVGYLAYEVAARWERLPVPEADPVALPLALFHLPDAVIVFDHLAQVATLATRDGPGAQERLDRLVARLGTVSRDERPVAVGRPTPATDPAILAGEDEGRARYEAGVASLVEDIHAGEMLQAVLARRFTLPTRRPALDVYRSLRRINPSPHQFLLRLDGDAALVGASPELLVRVRDGEVVTRPIAGTRRRSADPVEDVALEDELKADAKELAEHAMLVDLGRNDVGRVAEVGSVRVPVLRSVERYSHVMHLVSEVRGRLRGGMDAFDAVRATFPAGTLTGAPKVRAMQAIAALEQEQRGAYGGAVGIFSPWEVEAAITIRSVVLRSGQAFVHAGAGIVADSDPGREAAEVAAKARATITAVVEGTEARA